MGLDPCIPLNSMFHRTQQRIGFRKQSRFALGNKTRPAQALKSGKYAGYAQRPVPATPDKLQRLHEELDLSNASGAKLEVACRVGSQFDARPSQELGKYGHD